MKYRYGEIRLCQGRLTRFLKRERGPYVDSFHSFFVVGARNQIDIMYNFMEKGCKVSFFTVEFTFMNVELFQQN